MAEPPMKPGEHYPLLKPGTDNGDHVVFTPATVWIGPNKPNPVKSRLKFSELFFAFWIALTFFIIGILLFYAFASLYYDVSWTTVKTVNHCSQELKTKNHVFLQYIIARGSDVPFSTFTEILSKIALKYPKIAFAVQFYLSDGKEDFSKFKEGWLMMNQDNQNNISAFVAQHRNVLVEFKTVSDLMNSTPLRSYGLTLRYLTFYASVYEVWKNGAASFDLGVLTKKSQYGKPMETYMENILESYNEGRIVQYNDVMYEEQKDIGADLMSFFFFDMIQQFINDTRDMFSMDDPFGNTRFKRNNVEMINHKDIRNEDEKSVSNNNFTQEAYLNISTSNLNIANASTEVETQSTGTLVTTTETPMRELPDEVDFNTRMSAVKPNRFFLLFSRNSRLPIWNKEITSRNDLYMSKDGSFVATEMKRNPFLEKILFTNGCPRLTPECVIEKLYMEQCSSIDQCDSIHIF